MGLQILKDSPLASKDIYIYIPRIFQLFGIYKLALNISFLISREKFQKPFPFNLINPYE